ncbi:MAG: type II toxin-antitoxin system HicB family antitoxin [Deltaproteobacteria bacterium]|nr:type II toxin-antitoxin system HicB family antitoxin [Deltaproteobacteria bacterium]
MKPSGEFPRYSYYITWSQEDKEFVASFIELPGLSGLGATIAEAIRELKEALFGWMETAQEQGFEVPEPIQKDAPYPLVVVDRTLMGKDPIVADLGNILPEEIGTETKTAETINSQGLPTVSNINAAKDAA